MNAPLESSRPLPGTPRNASPGSDAGQLPERGFGAIAEKAPDHIIRYDRELKRTYVNPAVGRAYGLPLEALLGKPLGSVVEDGKLSARPGEVEALRRRIATVFQTGESSEFDFTFPSPAGRTAYNVSLHPEFSEDGAVLHVLGIGRDVTALEETRRQLLALAENSPDVIVRCSCDGRILYVNRAVEAFTGIPAASFPGHLIGAVTGQRLGAISPGFVELRRAIGRACATGQSEEVEATLRVTRGEGTFHWRAIPERDEAGRVVSVLLIGQDVTERKQGEEVRRRLLRELMRTREAERSAVARELHDEVGQSVSALGFGIEMIEQVGTVEEARRHAQRLRKVAADALESLRRLAHGLHPRVLDDLGLVAAVEQCAREYEESFGIAVDLAVDGLDGVRLPKETEVTLYRIVREALTNVARHSGASRASVVLGRRGASVEVVVEDDGHGFDAEALLDVSDPSRAFGLRGIVESASLLDGTARIESAPGRGATVVVRIPHGG